LPGPGVTTVTALLFEALLTVGLVSTILGTASGAQQVGPFAAIAVGSYIALAGLWGSPISSASMNPARSLGPALVLGDWTSWWAYLAGPTAGGIIAVGIAYILRGPGGGKHSIQAAQGTLGVLWVPARSHQAMPAQGHPRQAGDPQGGGTGGADGGGTGGARGGEAGGAGGSGTGGGETGV
jgi:aquaporin Z